MSKKKLTYEEIANRPCNSKPSHPGEKYVPFGESCFRQFIPDMMKDRNHILHGYDVYANTTVANVARDRTHERSRYWRAGNPVDYNPKTQTYDIRPRPPPKKD